MTEPSDVHEKRNATRGRVLQLAKIVVSVGLIGVLCSRIDVARLWPMVHEASAVWLIAALGLYAAMILVSAWRWGLLLHAQGVHLPFRALTSSFLVATFFNNFLPSNIGGDVVRVTDTSAAAGSKTLAATVVLIDRGVGLLGLVLLAAVAATTGAHVAGGTGAVGAGVLWAGFGVATLAATPMLLVPHHVVRLLEPLRRLHAEWVDERLGRLTGALARFRESPEALAGCFAGAIAVQALIVAFYLAIAASLRVPVGFTELAVIVPVSLLAQMVPVSVNGFGVREATFAFYFSRLGLTLESALLISFTGAALVMLFSLTGAGVYLDRRRRAYC